LFTLRHSPSVGIWTLFMFVASHGWSALLSLFRLVGRVQQIKRDSKKSASVLKHHSLPAVKRAHGDPWTVVYLSFYSDIVGGGEISLLHLVQALDRQRVRPILLCPREGELSRKFRELGAEVHLVLFPHTLWGVLNGTVLRLARWMSKTGADVVHVNTAGRMLFLSGLAARCLGIPVVWHARIAEREPLADRLATSLVDRIIATSQYVAGRFQRGRAKNKVVCIPNPIDLSRFQPNPDGKGWREQNGLPVHSILVGIFGRLDAWKRFDLALRAAALARVKQESLHFMVVGKGPERRSLERLARDLDLKKSLSFLDWQDDVTKAMSSIDILLHPTPGEHFGRVYIEAMACGKPVVAADSGGAREIVLSEQTGILVPPNDPGALAKALVRLAANETLCQSMGRAGRRRAETLFDARRVAGLVENLYDDILTE
jgi:glycosyltransferase involved in cell wall biosynthesis